VVGLSHVGVRVVDQFVVHRNDDVLFLRRAPGVRIEHALAVEAATALSRLSEGLSLPLVVVMGGIDGLSLKTRMGMNAYRGFSVVALVGDGPVDEVLAGFAQDSSTRTRYFMDENEALSWVEAGAVSKEKDGSAA
jgi:hypothetical protein